MADLLTPKGAGDKLYLPSDWNAICTIVNKLVSMAAKPKAIREFFPARIVSSSPLNDWQFEYELIEPRWKGPGIDDWEDGTEGYVKGTFGTVKAFHIAEVGNNTNDRLGNGILKANIPTDYTFQPVPTGVLVMAWEEIGDNGVHAYWFAAPSNGIDGTCE